MKVLIQDRRPPTAPPTDWPYRNEDLFAPASFWKTPIPASPPLHASSTAWVGNLCDQFHVSRTGSGPWGTPAPGVGGAPTFGFGGNYRVLVVPEDQPLVSIGDILILAQLSGVPGYVRPFHDQVMSGVPLPDDVGINRVDADQERGVSIWQPSTDKWWELMGLRPLGDPWRAMESARDNRHYEGLTPGTFEGISFTWTCTNGAVLHDVSANNGVYRGTGLTYPLYGTGGAATALPYGAGLITPEEARAVLHGERDDFGHVLKASYGNAGAGFVSPAQRGDGAMSPATWIPEGARAYLDITDFSPYAAELPMFQALIKTLARYGIMGADKTGSSCVFPCFRDPNGYRTFPLPLSEFGPSYFSLKYKIIPWHLARVVAASVSPP